MTDSEKQIKIGKSENSIPLISVDPATQSLFWVDQHVPE